MKSQASEASSMVAKGNIVARDAGLVATQPKKDSAYAWVVCVCGSVASILAMGCAFASGILYPYFLEEFKESKAVTAFAGALAIASGCVFGPLAGKICDRVGSRVAMVFSTLPCAAGLLASAFAPNMVTLYFTYGLVFGCGSCVVYFAALVFVPRYFDRRRYIATGMVTSGPGAGLFVISPITEALCENFGWRKTMMSFAAIMLSPGLLGLVFPKDKDRVRREGDSTCKRGCQVIDLSLFKNWLYLLYTAALTVLVYGHTSPSAHLAKYYRELGLPGNRSSWLYFLMGLTSVVSRLLTGPLCDSKYVSPSIVFQIGALILAIDILLLPSATSYEWLLVFAVVYGTSEGMTMTSNHCNIISLLPSHLIGHGFGWYIAIIGSGYFIGPIIGGLIADVTGSYKASFYAAGSLVFAGFCLPFLARFCPRSSTQAQELELDWSGATLIVTERETCL
ncbi:monocarboxylate transporter 13 isoform X1 [Nematostella vectensis]|uniref:monocarboxylate transporter 13 isoform X1 n=2 Tax=Nematostella vectensis TaxID=45351 RepID=UPI00139045E8|nr:monocarboxylate transporter 13 isoform X1 [Nematostella vectensis]